MLDLKVGDKVTRMIAGSIPDELIVVHISSQIIYCGNGTIGMDMDDFNGWTFDREFGYEIDEDLGWGEKDEHGKIITGSFLILGSNPGAEVELRSKKEVIQDKILALARERQADN